MPEIIREPRRLDCSGVDLVHPLDRQPPGAFPYLQNIRVRDEGRLDSRPGYTLYDSAATSFHTMRRLNDEDMSEAPAGYIDILGGGSQVWAGAQGAINPVASGFSGDPLSILTFRPDQSPESWAYIYDQNKQIKVSPSKQVKQIGLPPTQAPLLLEYGPPNWLIVDDGQSATNWAALGGSSAGAISLQDRNLGAAGSQQITAILYNSGTTGWCCIVPDEVGSGLMVPDNYGARSGVVLQGSSEKVIVREVHPSCTGATTFNTNPGVPVFTTIAGIQYDAGTTGPCTIVLAAPPQGGDYTLLTRNSVLGLVTTLGGTPENVRVLSVSTSPDGSTYSIRCSTVSTHAAGTIVFGWVSLYVYTTINHGTLETINSHWVQVASLGSGSGNVTIQNTSPVNPNLATLGGRPFSIANDYMHISLIGGYGCAYVLVNAYIGNTGITSNYYQFTIPGNQFNPTGWTEFTLPFSQAQLIGNNPSLAAVCALGITFQQADPTAVADYGFDWWDIFGTYGPDVPPNSPVGLSYSSRSRDSTTGVASVPGPPARHQLFPQREQVLVQPNGSSVPEVDSLDIYRLGNTLTGFTYIGAVPNSGTAVYSDNLPDASVEGNPQADTTLLQPWPVLDLPWAGTVNVVGTTVNWATGTQFKANLVNATVILINGVAFQVYGNPSSGTRLEIFNSAGVQNGASFTVASPLLAAVPLPFAFGPLEGPLAPVAFGLGNPVNPGTLYYTNTANLDAASDQNTLEICGPSEGLVSGACWNGLVFVGSRDNIYLVRYSFLQTLGVPGQTTYQFNRIPSPSGMWSPWSCCAGQDGVYFLGRDGIYRATESGAVNITDERLYPLFPHDGQAAVKTNAIAPIDMTQLSALRLSAADQDIYFDYASVGS